MKSKQLTGEALRFAVVGAAATGLHYGVYYALLWAVPAGAVWLNAAYVVGYVVSFAFNFLATSLFTFHARPTWRRLMGMAGAHGVNLALHVALFNAAILILRPALAPILVYAVAVPVNFVLVRLAFKKL